MSKPTAETLLIRRLTAALQNLIEDSPDPGSEALSAVWEGKHYRAPYLPRCARCTVCAGAGDGLTGGHYQPDHDFIEAPYMEPCSTCKGTGLREVQDLTEAYRAACRGLVLRDREIASLTEQRNQAARGLEDDGMLSEAEEAQLREHRDV